nr:PEP-CTERM sorting domain-containing protein [uncultured Desulfobacter sp.]
MKKNFKIFIPIVLLAFSFLPVAYSAPNIDGVMSYTDADDWGGGSVTRTSKFRAGAEWVYTWDGWQEYAGTSLANVVVEEGAVAAGDPNVYDVEELGVYIEDKYLYIGLQTQYNISTPAGTSGVVNAGDFIFTFGDSDDTTFSDYNDGNYAFAFDFTIDSNGVVDITYLSGDMTGTGVGSSVNNYGTDWGIASASIDTSVTGTEIEFTYGYSDHDADSKDNCYSDGKYTLELAINLDSLSDELSTLLSNPGDHDSLSMYWQPSCGNDFLAAKTDFDYTPPSGGASPTPEPATMLLFGMGLLCASAWRRRRSRSEKFD